MVDRCEHVQRNGNGLRLLLFSARAFAQGFEDEPKRRQPLTKSIVQFAGKPASLVLLGHDEPSEQSCARNFGLCPIGNFSRKQGPRFR
jgi:hypothetical protein